MKSVKTDIENQKSFRILFVCVGNICRSPTAEGVFKSRLLKRGLSDHIDSDSAGTTAYHIGEAPDNRAQAAALRRGYDLSAIRARKISAADFERFDLLLAMDRGVLLALNRYCPPDRLDRVRLFMDFSSHRKGGDVTDPYYGGQDGFEHVLDMIEDAAEAIIETSLVRMRSLQQG